MILKLSAENWTSSPESFRGSQRNIILEIPQDLSQEEAEMMTRLTQEKGCVTNARNRAITLFNVLAKKRKIS